MYKEDEICHFVYFQAIPKDPVHTNIPQHMGSTGDLIRKTTPNEHKSVKQIVQHKNYLCKS